MLAVRKMKPGPGIVVGEVAEPALDDIRNVMIEVEAAGVCGSDLHLADWTPGYEWVGPGLPVTIGHEFAGHVSALGPNAVRLRIGDRVTVMPFVGCGSCATCLDGREEECPHRKALGFLLDGGFARYIAVPERNCLILPDNVDTEIGALTEPLSIAAHALRTGEFAAGDTVLVLGPGMIGQAIAVSCLLGGAARIILVGKGDSARLDFARTLGIDETVDLDETDLHAALGSMKLGKVDRVFEATGVPSTIDLGLSVLRREGIFVACGIHAAPATIDITRLVREKHQLRGAINHAREDWMAVLALLTIDPEYFRPLITHRLPLAAADEAFDLAHRRIASKVLLTPSA